jgi:hypothetical protein
MYEEDLAYNTEHTKGYLMAICRRMRRGFNWLLARAKALNVAVNNTTICCTVIRELEVYPGLKLVDPQHAYHGDWDLDLGTFDNCVQAGAFFKFF